MEPENAKTNEGIETKEETTMESRKEAEPLESKIQELQNELDAEKKRNAELVSKTKYLQADVINLQRQADRMVADAKNQTKLNWISEIIAIQEDLQRAIKVGAEVKNTELLAGLQMVLSRIENTLASEDVSAINVKPGQSFDPRFHEAVAFSESNKMEDGKILSVVGRGYTMGGKVIKPALVEVSRKVASKNEDKDLVPPPTVNEES
ncbi:MAG: nucleotide exchange factor GrpE [Nitrososphaerota archaeon]|nr:nucleotide exchange factor GrpE [Nitrososphaerota archaeon]